jgi:hypothetical protein
MSFIEGETLEDRERRLLAESRRRGGAMAGKKGTAIRHVCITNDVGGTTMLPEGEYKVEITRSWSDYEIGGRCIGFLTEAADIEIAREAGTTGFAKVGGRFREIKTEYGFEPERVYFAARDFREEA